MHAPSAKSRTGDHMMIPVRCFTCGTVVGSAYKVFKQAKADGKSGKDALDESGLRRFCCRRMLVSHTDLIIDAAPYE